MNANGLNERSCLTTEFVRSREVDLGSPSGFPLDYWLRGTRKKSFCFFKFALILRGH